MVNNMENFKKITTNNYEDFKNDYNNWIVDKVKTYLIGNIKNEQMLLEESLINCESPIEQLLAIELESLKLENMILYNPYIDVVIIDKQYEIINKKGKKYIADFHIPVYYKNQGYIYFIIECDGHNFHQKTKKQVEYDNERQRDLQELGYEIIRFSGTEIYNKPANCASKIKDIILSKCRYIKDE